MNNIPKDILNTMPEGIKVEQKFFSLDDAKKDKNSIVLEHKNSSDDAPVGIGNLELLTQRVIEFLQYINTDPMVEMENKDPMGFKMHVIDKFIDYFDDNSKVFTSLLDKQHRANNVAKLLNVIELLAEVKAGNRDLVNETDRFHEEHNEKYVYPKFGGKAAFESTLQKRAKKKNNK